MYKYFRCINYYSLLLYNLPVLYITSHLTDINECSDSNGGCDDDCINTIGSFYCECDSGYTLQTNGKTCNGQLHVHV